MVAIYLDSADLDEMWKWRDKVSGYTTNPSLMRKAGVKDYLDFARNVLQAIQDKPISFEVTSDDQVSMEAQARLLASLAPNVVVKIPITNTRGEYTSFVMGALRRDNIKINVTAVMTEEQVSHAAAFSPEIISIFCGRIQDTGRSPIPILNWAMQFKAYHTKILWASARSVYSVKEAEQFCDIITLSPDLLAKLDLFGKDLTEYSLDTVKMFFNDAQKAGYVL